MYLSCICIISENQLLPLKFEWFRYGVYYGQWLDKYLQYTGVDRPLETGTERIRLRRSLNAKLGSSEKRFRFEKIVPDILVTQ